jgi:glycosyltransferase involved in cell wall biosynthesis
VIATRLDIDVCNYFSVGNNILEMLDAESLSAAVARLKSEPAFWTQLSQAGRITVEKHANWDQCAATIVNEIHELLTARKGVTQN